LKTISEYFNKINIYGMLN